MDAEAVSCVVVGGGGRMGRSICALAGQISGVHLAGVTEAAGSPHVGKSLREAFGLPRDDIRVVDSFEALPRTVDVLIDFTCPGVSRETARFAARHHIAAVIGTTGFSPAEQAELEDLGRSFPCVWAPNMSLGVNALFQLVADAARILGQDFDAEVLEMHHRHKKDAPSGTALGLARILADTWGRDLACDGVFQREGLIGERPHGAIGVQSLRAGDVAGEHTVYFAGIGERIELTHRAQSRECFARGALHAACWLAGRPDGLYDMQDVLGLRRR